MSDSNLRLIIIPVDFSNHAADQQLEILIEFLDALVDFDYGIPEIITYSNFAQSLESNIPSMGIQVSFESNEIAQNVFAAYNLKLT